MTDYLIWLLLIALRILCLYICFQPGGVLYWVREKVVDRLNDWKVPDWVDKPLFDGLACMSSIWGTVIFFKDYFFGFSVVDCIMVVCGVLVILGNFINQTPEP